jgi:2-methylcitrate dehydratase PrpD
MQLTRRICEFITDTTIADVPPEVISQAKKNILDSIGVGLVGSSQPAGQIGLRLARWVGGLACSGILGSGMKTTPGMAGLVNGMMIHAVDYDDRNWSLTGHPSAPILPVALALGEKEDFPGREVLLAYILGVEVECKLGLGVLPDHSEKGWHQTTTLGTFGAAASAGKLLKLTAGQLENAFGIALSRVGGTKQNFGTMTKPLHAGNAAASGIEAAGLAKENFAAAPQSLEGKGGFFEVFCSPELVDQGKIVDHLGDPYEFATPGVNIKAYPSCGGTHSTIEAVIALAEENDLRPEQVDRVRCGVHYRRPMTLIRNNPQTPLEGKFSLQYCAAISLMDRRVGLAQFTDERMKDPQVQELMKRVEMYVHPEMTQKHSEFQYASDVTIYTRDGRMLQKRVDLAKGNPGHDISEKDRLEKFRECAGTVLTSDKSEKVIDLVGDLDTLPRITELCKIIM